MIDASALKPQTGAVSLTAEQLKSSGLGIVVNGLRKNDEITFPTWKEYEENWKKFVIQRPVGTSGKYEILVACTRNGNPDWYSISDVRRRDINNNPLGEFRRRMTMEMANDFERLKYLADKTIQAGEPLVYQVTKFEDGQPVLDENGDRVADPKNKTCYDIIEA